MNRTLVHLFAHSIGVHKKKNKKHNAFFGGYEHLVSQNG